VPVAPRNGIPGPGLIGAKISAGEGETPDPRPLIVITGLDPVISRGTSIVWREMARSSPAMTLRGWRNTVRLAAGSYLGAYGVEPKDDG
jgi:hypothetical protein